MQVLTQVTTGLETPVWPLGSDSTAVFLFTPDVELALSSVCGHGLVPAPFLAATVPGAVLSAA
jgi:hypothetical protein